MRISKIQSSASEGNTVLPIRISLNYNIINPMLWSNVDVLQFHIIKIKDIKNAPNRLI